MIAGKEAIRELLFGFKNYEVKKNGKPTNKKMEVRKRNRSDMV